MSTRTEAFSMRGQVASQAEEVQQRQLGFGQITREQDQSQSQAAKAVSRAEIFGEQLAGALERLAEVPARFAV
jgi:hypothetical protein